MRLFAVLQLLALSIVNADVKLKTDRHGVTKLDDLSFQELTRAPREHYSVILLTALPAQFGCHFCHEFDPEFDILASSWRKSGASSNGPQVHFGRLDFKDGGDTFRALQLASAPNLWVYPPTVDEDGAVTLGEPSRYDFTYERGADAAAAFVSRVTGKEFPIKRPFDYLKFGKFVFSIAFAALGALMIYRVAGFIFFNKHFWAIITLVLILVFNAGHMYTQIRNSPYTRGGGYIAGGFQDQNGAETQIVAATCKPKPPSISPCKTNPL